VQLFRATVKYSPIEPRLFGLQNWTLSFFLNISSPFDLLPSIQYLRVSKHRSPGFIDAAIAYLQIFDSVQTLYSAFSVYINLWMPFIHYL
jgi:hypothetical protein